MEHGRRGVTVKLERWRAAQQVNHNSSNPKEEFINRRENVNER